MKKGNHGGHDRALELLHIYAYHNPANRKVTALNLWKNGIRLFGQAKVVKDFDVLKSIPHTKDEAPSIKHILPFLHENIIDKTRIITCFENYLKGLLLINGYIAHKLSKNEKVLLSAQNGRPIGIGEVFNINTFATRPSSVISSHPTTPYTLTFSTLLKPHYQSVLQIPLDIVSILDAMNEERNNLHFLAGLGFSIGKSEIRDIERLIEFVSQEIGVQILALNRELYQVNGALDEEANLREGFVL